MIFCAKKNVENKIALSGALQALLLDVLEEDFLLFCH